MGAMGAAWAPAPFQVGSGARRVADRAAWPHGLAGAAAGLALLWPVSPGCPGAEGPQDDGARLTVKCRFSALEVAPRGISVSVGARALESAFLTCSQ